MRKCCHMNARVVRVFALTLCAITLFTCTASAASVSWGSSGATVRSIQTKLKQWGYFNGTIDGVYGAQTYEAVKLFQRRNGLTVDGVVGASTARAMGITLSGTSVPTSSGSSTSEVRLLARAVHGEARGEGYKGKVAVAAVILNRVKSPAFPNTIAGVVYQPGAFDAVSDGQINLEPDSESLRAAQDAMNGWDPTNGALYYYNPAKATASWIYTRKVVTVIGSPFFAIWGACHGRMGA